MPDPSLDSLVNEYWAAEFGFEPEELFAEPLRIVTHRNSLANYHGVFSLFRGGAAIVSLPSNQADALRPLLANTAHDPSPAALACALQSVAASIIGPAWLGYALAVPPPSHAVRALDLHDFRALHALRQSCDPIEWEHGGSPLAQEQGKSPAENPCSGIFVDGLLAAVASYEIWGSMIAHISIITHPDFRGRGFARGAVAHLATRALTAGLLPQYRTLESNFPSLRVAGSLGFRLYARSLAVRLLPAP